VDNYGSLQTPVMGPIIAAFQGHHGSPWTITYRGFANNVHKVHIYVWKTILCFQCTILLQVVVVTRAGIGKSGKYRSESPSRRTSATKLHNSAAQVVGGTVSHVVPTTLVMCTDYYTFAQREFSIHSMKDMTAPRGPSPTAALPTTCTRCALVIVLQFTSTTIHHIRAARILQYRV
jgi:Lipid desaturase domain